MIVLCFCDRASCAKCEEGISTTCNNIDDLLSIIDVDYWLMSRHVSGIFMPIIRRKDHVLLHIGYLLVVLDVVGCSSVVLRCRVWALWRLLLELQPSQCSHPVYFRQHNCIIKVQVKANATCFDLKSHSQAKLRNMKFFTVWLRAFVKNLMVLSLAWGWHFKSKHVALALTHAFII